MHANHLKKTEQSHQLNSDRSNRSPPPVRPVPNIWTGPALWPVRPVWNRAQNGSEPPENLLNASSSPNQPQTSPPCWQCTNQAKNAKNTT
jgi:hypothetical protein